jgi:hypothetical protein
MPEIRDYRGRRARTINRCMTTPPKNSVADVIKKLGAGRKPATGTPRGKKCCGR